MGAQEPIYSQVEWQRIADAVVAAVPDDHWIFHNQNSLIWAIHRAAQKFLDAEDPRERSARVTADLKAMEKAAEAAETFLTALEECGYYDPMSDDNDEWMERVSEFPEWVVQVKEYNRGRKAKPPHLSWLSAENPDLRGGRNPPWDEFLREVCMFWTYTLGIEATRSRKNDVATGHMVNFIFACSEPLRLRPKWMHGKNSMTPEMALKAIEDFKIYCDENMPNAGCSWDVRVSAAIKGDMA
jgi:hypothetical protein